MPPDVVRVLGRIRIRSGIIGAADPCDDGRTSDRILAVRGRWSVSVVQRDLGPFWGVRNAEMMATMDGQEKCLRWEPSGFWCHVESGMAAIFDVAEAEEIPCMDDDCGDGWATASSGIGDGSYEVLVARGEAVRGDVRLAIGVKVVFLPYEKEDRDQDELLELWAKGNF